MRKIYSFIILIILLTLVGCNFTNVPNDNNEEPDITEDPVEIPNFIDGVIPNTINSNYELPRKIDIYDLKFYIDDVEIENYQIVYPFSHTNRTIEIVMETIIGSRSKRFSKTVTFEKAQNVYDLYITTDSGLDVFEKKLYLNGTASIRSNDSFNQYNLLMKIRGRGNSTWEYEKKPYRIKFDKDESLLGMRPAKDYVLLAEFGDKSLLREHISHFMSQDLNLGYKVETRHVNVYFNNRYDGVYILTEQVKISDHRLNIDTGDNYNGFLIQLEVFERLEDTDIENQDYFVWKNRPYLIKSPDLSKMTEPYRIAKVNEIRSFLQQAYDSMQLPSYTNLIDENSFIDFFILQEITKNVDVNFSSVNMYREHNGKLQMGPAWDFDISMGNGDYYSYQPQGYWAINNMLLNRLLTNKTFKTNYIDRFKEVINLYQEKWLHELDDAAIRIRSAANKNFIRWNVMYDYVWPNPQEMLDAHNHQEQVLYLKSWLIKRFDWILKNIDNL